MFWTRWDHQIRLNSKSLYLILFEIFKLIKYSRSPADVNFDPNWTRLILKVKTSTFYTYMSQIHMQGQEMNHKGESFKIAYFCLTIIKVWREEIFEKNRKKWFFAYLCYFLRSFQLFCLGNVKFRKFTLNWKLEGTSNIGG